MLRIKRHINTFYTSITYVIYSDDLQACWIVDVGDCRVICKMIEGYELKGVFLTHVHYDHIYGLNDLQNLYPKVPIYTNNFGMKSLTNPSDNLSVYHEDSFILRDISNVIVLKEEDRIDLGDKQVVVMETPGHDYSCLSFLIDGICFTGDAYIPNSKVFTKLHNGNCELAKISQDRLKKLNVTKICPGHI